MTKRKDLLATFEAVIEKAKWPTLSVLCLGGTESLKLGRDLTMISCKLSIG